MTTKSTKSPINEESKKIAEDLITTEEMYRGYDTYIENINNENKINKENFNKVLFNEGDSLVSEMETLKSNREISKKEKVLFIVKKTNINIDYINSLSDEEINYQYKNLIKDKKGFLRKLIDFLF